MQDGVDEGWPLETCEIAPVEGAEQQAKFASRKNKALAIIVQSLTDRC